MPKRTIVHILLITATIAIFPAAFAHGNTKGPTATVSMVEGHARSYAAGSKKGHVLKRGDILRKDQEVKVGNRSRLEIRFPDGTVMRFAEKSVFRVDELKYDRHTEQKNIAVGFSIGKLWAKVKKLLTSDSSLQVKTSNAVAGVRGTVYRMNVNEDKSAVVKVYDGTVYVANPPRTASTTPATTPHEVAGPHEVPPPYHEVSMEEWTAIVKAMQQITISPQGVPSQPEDFDPKDDADDWVRWNKERDKQLSF